MDLPEASLAALPGIGKSMLEAIQSLKATGSFPALEALLAQTPTGVLEMLRIKGLGPKKVRALWLELGLSSTHELLEACQSGKVATTKGFGEKTQETILQNLIFTASNSGKWLYADIEATILGLQEKLIQQLPQATVRVVGDLARRMEVIETGDYLIASDDLIACKSHLRLLEGVTWDLTKSGPMTWRGQLEEPALALCLHFCAAEALVAQELLWVASKAHLSSFVDEEETVAEKIRKNSYRDEADFFEKNQLQFIPRELREGYGEVALAKAGTLPVLLENSDLKGILHNHSTYSDGKHSLRQMAEYCKSLGYDYLGISDHSRTASYAGGLDIEKVARQQAEIDALNQELGPFRIFKGIESDILTDGSLDYPEEVLASFDFIVSSIHSVLTMDRKRATDRLLTAIHNPYTTMLGHPTGRLLLRREGYPIDHQAVIDACAERQVVIEINANPWRLDLDWRWIRYAMEKGVLLSINPDAHAMEGYADMQYGVWMGRKGGLTKEMTFNALNGNEIAAYFAERKANIKSNNP
jgi:DNA polymerase (family 10)